MNCYKSIRLLLAALVMMPGLAMANQWGAEVLGLNPLTYTMNADGSKQVGLIAQDVEAHNMQLRAEVNALKKALNK